MKKQRTAIITFGAFGALGTSVAFSIAEGLFDNENYLTKILIIIAVAGISIVAVRLALQIVLRYLVKSEFYAETFEKKFDVDFSDESKSICPYHHAPCCGSTILKQAPGLISLSPESRLKYHLKMESEINNIERSITINDEVWVLSKSLESEVLGDDSQDIVENNLNRGVTYRQFYTFLSGDINNEELVEENKKKLTEQLLEEGKKNLHFVPIARENQVCDYLIQLTELVLFKRKNRKLEGYFRLKSKYGFENSNNVVGHSEKFSIQDESRKAIYYRMSDCMAKSYLQLLTKAKDQDVRNHEVQYQSNEVSVNV